MRFRKSSAAAGLARRGLVADGSFFKGLRTCMQKSSESESAGAGGGATAGGSKVEEDRMEEDRMEEDRVEEDRVEEDRVEMDRVEEDRVEMDRVEMDGLEVSGRVRSTMGDGASRRSEQCQLITPNVHSPCRRPCVRTFGLDYPYPLSHPPWACHGLSLIHI